MCLFSLEDEQTHIIRGTTSIGAFAPTSNPDNGGIPKGHTDGASAPCSGLGSAAAIPIPRAELSPSSARFNVNLQGLNCLIARYEIP